MTLQDFYQAAGGNYSEVLDRLMDEKRVLKYLKRFVDTTDYDDMLHAIKEEDWETSFRASHSIKGMALNLCLGKLAEASGRLCETMRHGQPTVDISPLLAEMEAKYMEAVALIAELPTQV